MDNWSEKIKSLPTFLFYFKSTKKSFVILENRLYTIEDIVNSKNVLYFKKS